MLESLKEWKGALIVIGILLLLTPLFAWAADLVGYAEPLENAAEHLGAMEHETAIISGILPDYTIPGANPYASAIVAGIVGCVIVLVIGILVGKALAR
ncbi:MAG: ABC-type Co2+ transport system [Methanophagales archaeon]|nr:PDGLE domain-containing protein [Methanophagales archaeon]MCU4139536.1 ABC-type Co2+ transport system [Methanophagales archaeon]